jgi:hypothetical protein
MLGSGSRSTVREARVGLDVPLTLRKPLPTAHSLGSTVLAVFDLKTSASASRSA